MAEAGLREQGWPYLKDDLRPPYLPLCRDKSSPETWGGADEKVQSLLSVPLTLVPEAVVPNNYWSQNHLQLWGEKEREKRDGWGSVMARLNPVVSLGPLRCPCRSRDIQANASFCGIFSPLTLLAGPAVWLCLNCHPAKAAWWHAQTLTQQTHQVYSPLQNFFKA